MSFFNLNDLDRGHSVSSGLGECQLWCAVIIRALEDALGNPTSISDAMARARAIEEARHWFFSNDADFRLACHAAGYEPDVLRRRVMRLLAAGAPPARRRTAALPTT
ncbi:MAG TPA: hypothetical protein VF342_06190 [Alphaproteobacteria bacterium]